MVINYLNSHTDEVAARMAQLEAELQFLKSRIQAQIKTIIVPHLGMRRMIIDRNIIMIKSDSNYSEIYLVNNEKILTSKTLKYWQNKLDTDMFIRCHASYLVNKAYIITAQASTRTLTLIESNTALVSRRLSSNICKQLSDQPTCKVKNIFKNQD